MNFMNFLKPLFLLFFSTFVYSQTVQEFYPIYVTGGVPLSEYTLFANTGWDGNWYIGTNMCWIKRFTKEMLPSKDIVKKLFVGVKLGRAKIQQKPGSPPWEPSVINGNIYVAVSSTPSWKSNQRFFLCSIKDIPTEGDWENAITTTGEAKWFYAEIPTELVDFDSDQWVCAYSNTPNLTSVSSAPILAGGWRERNQKDSNVWLNNEINGSPPIDPNNSLKTQIRAFDPAIVLKFIPSGAEENKVELRIMNISEGRKDTDEKVFYIKSLTPNIERLWMEISQDKTSWQRMSKYVYTQPYVFILNIPSIPQEINGDFYIRFSANDIFENIGHTTEIQLNIARTQPVQPVVGPSHKPETKPTTKEEKTKPVKKK